MSTNLDSLRKYEIPGRVAVTTGSGGLPKVVATSKTATAEIYPHGAHLAHFQKNGEPPLIFMSRKSWFAPGKPIRGGVPVILPWFGNRDGQPSHGLARITEWELVNTSAGADDVVKITFAMPKAPGQSEWNSLRTEFTVTVADTLTMELTTTNEACDGKIEIEDCLHTYFQVGDIGAVTITGLEDAAFLDFAAGATGTPCRAEHTPIKIQRETNRTYIDTASTVVIRDDQLRRTIRVEKSGSHSSVVWNPWTTQKLPDDFDPAEHKTMVCVESGNVKKNKIVLGAGQTTSLKVVISSAALK
jgi:D-hexose-6-phosphate mutarotase